MGSRAEGQTNNALIDTAVEGNLPMPQVRFVDAGSLGAGAQGAYDPRGGGTILLDHSLLADPVAMERVFIEEAGHHFDALFGEGDASGGEGALFARSMLGEDLSTADIFVLRAENDHGSVMLDGRLVDVEFNYDEVGIDTPSTNTSNNNSSNNGRQSDNDHDDKPTKKSDVSHVLILAAVTPNSQTCIPVRLHFEPISLHWSRSGHRQPAPARRKLR